MSKVSKSNIKNWPYRDFPDGPVVKTHRRAYSFDPWLGNNVLHAMWPGQKKKKRIGSMDITVQEVNKLNLAKKGKKAYLVLWMLGESYLLHAGICF